MAIGIIKKKKPEVEIKMLDYEKEKDPEIEKILEKKVNKKSLKRGVNGA